MPKGSSPDKRCGVYRPTPASGTGEATASGGGVHRPSGAALPSAGSLPGDREGQYSICVNDQWRVSFIWTDRGAMEIEITDYH